VRYDLEERGEMTLLSQNGEIRFKGSLRVVMILAGWAFRRKLMNQARSELARLKDLCERGEAEA
jgi:hypothetical protein